MIPLFRSSLEVPTNSSRQLGGGVPARTSMSESLAEEEEEVSLVPRYGFERWVFTGDESGGVYWGG